MALLVMRVIHHCNQGKRVVMPDGRVLLDQRLQARPENRMTVSSKLRAYLEGFDARIRLREDEGEFRKPLPISKLECPYDDEMELHKAWLLGWIDAARDCRAPELSPHMSILH
jgi:hypothetical protein